MCHYCVNQAWSCHVTFRNSTGDTETLLVLVVVFRQCCHIATNIKYMCCKFMTPIYKFVDFYITIDMHVLYVVLEGDRITHRSVILCKSWYILCDLLLTWELSMCYDCCCLLSMIHFYCTSNSASKVHPTMDFCTKTVNGLLILYTVSFYMHCDYTACWYYPLSNYTW